MLLHFLRRLLDHELTVPIDELVFDRDQLRVESVLSRDELRLLLLPTRLLRQYRRLESEDSVHLDRSTDDDLVQMLERTARETVVND